MTFKAALVEWCKCDDCGKTMNLMDYYNQDGICIECFEKWMDSTEELITDARNA